MNFEGEKSESILRLAELTDIFYERTNATLASVMVDKCIRTDSPNLRTKLRHHSAPPGYIRGSLIRERDWFDYLLEYYSILEIAGALQSLPDPLPDELKNRALQDLSHPAVRLYYERHYPLLLPQLFRRRLETGEGVQVQFGANGAEDSREKAYYLFSVFIGLATWMCNDPEIETFQWFLDDGMRGGFKIRDTIRVIRNRDQFANSITKSESKRNTLDKSIIGFQKFVEFCIRFHQLLESAHPFPVLQGQLWQFFEYWFVALSDKVGRYVLEAVQHFADWEPLDNLDRQQAKKEVEEYVRLAQTSISSLLARNGLASGGGLAGP
ncbi:MAG: hypothetical protein KDA91_21945 [Planctomycetaceae bacterium]|nr:hypothetical protein [Planctomycetaceae bacterium]